MTSETTGEASVEPAAAGSAADVVTPAHLGGVLADRSRWSAGGRCSIDRAMRLVGTRSAMLLMREAFYGTTRFDDFATRVGITEAVAAARLKELVEAGLLRRSPYREAGQRTRYEYLLTEMGAELVPAAVALMQWGDKYLADSSGPPLQLTHDDCGAEVLTVVRCAAGHTVELADVTVSVRRSGPA